MVTMKTLMCASIVVSLATLIVAFIVGDYYWLVPVLFNVALMAIVLRGDTSKYYSRWIVIGTIVPMVLQIILCSVHQSSSFTGGHLILGVNVYQYMSALFMSISSFISGIMVITRLENLGVGIHLTKRWIILLAMVFSLSISVGSLFFQFAYLYFQGYPVFNLEIVNPDDRVSNNIMMVSPLVTTFSSAVMALLTVRLLRGKGKDALYEEGCQ